MEIGGFKPVAVNNWEINGSSDTSILNISGRIFTIQELSAFKESLDAIRKEWKMLSLVEHVKHKHQGANFSHTYNAGFYVYSRIKGKRNARKLFVCEQPCFLADEFEPFTDVIKEKLENLLQSKVYYSCGILY